jgi:glucokinase
MSDQPVLVGLDVGGTKVLAMAIEAAGPLAVVAEHQVPSPGSTHDLLEVLATCVATVAGSRPVAAVGVGVPGFVDLGGVARRAPHLAAVVDVDVGALIRDRLGVPVHVDNDANCAAWAAHRVDAPGSQSTVAVTLGTGIGAGLVLDGRMWRGAHGFAGEPGHMMVDAQGPECACGQHGCWEVWASGAGLGRVARHEAEQGRAPDLLARAGGSHHGIDSPMVTAAAAEGSAEAQAVLERYGWWVAVGLVNLVNTLDPQSVVLGGGIVANGDLVLDPIRRQLATFPTLAGVQGGAVLDLRISSLGPKAGAIGAAWLAGGS